jgi:hypothetical protein
MMDKRDHDTDERWQELRAICAEVSVLSADACTCDTGPLMDEVVAWCRRWQPTQAVTPVPDTRERVSCPGEHCPGRGIPHWHCYCRDVLAHSTSVVECWYCGATNPWADQSQAGAPAAGSAPETASRCPPCCHAAHTGVCPARSGGTAYGCGCSRVAIPALQATAGTMPSVSEIDPDGVPVLVPVGSKAARSPRDSVAQAAHGDLRREMADIVEQMQRDAKCGTMPSVSEIDPDGVSVLVPVGSKAARLQRDAAPQTEPAEPCVGRGPVDGEWFCGCPESPHRMTAARCGYCGTVRPPDRFRTR